MNVNSSAAPKETDPGPFRRDYAVAPGLERYSPQPLHGNNAGELYQRLLECAADGIYGLDLNGYVTFVNPAARRMTGWSLDDLRGRTQHSMVHHSHVDGSAYPREDCPIYAALRDGKVHRRDDEVFWRKDGSSFAVEYSSAPIFEDGKPAGAVVVFRPIGK